MKLKNSLPKIRDPHTQHHLQSQSHSHQLPLKLHKRSSHFHDQRKVESDPLVHSNLPSIPIIPDIPLYKVLPLKDNFLPRRLPNNISPFSLFRDNSKLSVTDITTKYCELLNLYELCNGTKKTTSAMAAGTSVHSVLEKAAESNLIGLIQLQDDLILNESEKLAAKFIEMIIKIEALLSGHLVREFYVFAIVDDILITGYIDEISINSNHQLIITDTKSRAKGNLPPVSQRLSAFHQLLAYHKLLELMMNDENLIESFDKLYSAFLINREETFSDEFLSSIKSINHPFLSSCYTLEQLQARLFDTLSKLSNHATLSNEIQVSYHKSTGPQSGNVIDICRYSYSEETFQDLKDFSFSFWRGDRDAIGVDPSEHTKCRYCPMSTHCEWRHTMDAAMV